MIVKTFSHTDFKDVNIDYTEENTNYEKQKKGNFKYEKKTHTLSAVDVENKDESTTIESQNSQSLHIIGKGPSVNTSHRHTLALESSNIEPANYIDTSYRYFIASLLCYIYIFDMPLSVSHAEKSHL